MRLPLFVSFLAILFIVALQKTCSKAARFQIVTEAEKELFQRQAAGVHRRPKRKLVQNERKGGKKVKKEAKRKKTLHASDNQERDSSEEERERNISRDFFTTS